MRALRVVEFLAAALIISAPAQARPHHAPPAPVRTSRFSCERNLRFAIEWHAAGRAVLHLPGVAPQSLRAERRAAGIAYSNAAYRFTEAHDVGVLEMRRGRHLDSYNCAGQF